MTVNNTIAHQRLILSGDRERYSDLKISNKHCLLLKMLINMKRFRNPAIPFDCTQVMPTWRARVLKFKELLRRRLIECGWRDQVRMLCRDAVKDNEANNVTFDTLVTRVTPRARALVPDTVKKELLQKIKTHLLTQKDQ